MTRRSAAWTLDPPAFERLLRFLDADRQAAASRYEEIRQRLIKLFVWRGCRAPEECVDRTIDRVARRLGEGVEIQTRDPFHYFQGVALNVLREHVREPERALEPLASDAATAPVTETSDEVRLACLDECLAEMLPKNRELLLEYHSGDRHIERRVALARSLGIAVNALRIRVHRLRASVESCVTRCLAMAAAETNRSPTHS